MFLRALFISFITLIKTKIGPKLLKPNHEFTGEIRTQSTEILQTTQEAYQILGICPAVKASCTAYPMSCEKHIKKEP